MRCGWIFVGLAVLVLETAAAQSAGAGRTLIDPSTHARWVLRADPVHPGGPGTLVPLASAQPLAVSAPRQSDPPRIVIRAGDRLIVDESTPLLVARYAAVALAPAAAGERFLARFAAGAKPVQVVALGPGRAALAAAVVQEAQE